MTGPGVAGDLEKDIPLKLVNFNLPPPRALFETERETAVQSAITRIRDTAEEFNSSPDIPGQIAQVGIPASDMWMLLLVRMVTRAPASGEPVTEGDLKEEDGMQLVKARDDDRRRTLCNYVLEDFPSRLVFNCRNFLSNEESFRIQLATVWMNEEWYNDRIRIQQSPSWVSAINIFM